MLPSPPRLPLALLGESMLQAVASLRANRLRSGLAALALAAAVATMSLVVTSLDGLERAARQAGARAFGTDTFIVARVFPSRLGRRELADKLARNPPIRRADARFLERWAGGEVIYAPTTQRTAEVAAGGRTFDGATVNGTSASLEALRDLGIRRGRFLRREEELSGAQVVVLGADLVDGLFPGVDPLGRTVRIARRGFLVIGVQARQGTAAGVSLDRYAWIPLRAFERLFGAPESLQLFARPVDGERIMAAEDRARATLRARRHLAPGERDNFDILTPEASRSFVTRLSQSIGAAGVPISAMALLAAMAVVTNTILVSITQRIREIGIRRAVGAGRGRIMAEVLAESLLVALGGGVVGLGLARLVLAIASGVLGVPLPLRLSTAAWSLFAAGAAGVLAGFYPARRAVAVEVTAALRRE